MYNKVTNVVVKLSSNPQQEGRPAVLINGHFDSAPGSPGAADDGIAIACMLEIIRALAASEKIGRLTHDVIFLFNGAEENNHQAAHGFISQHSWAPAVKYLINLEAIGSGGREMVFQCNTGWMAAEYGKSAPYPYIQVTAHELFKVSLTVYVDLICMNYLFLFCFFVF